jgi:C-terminal processing protease CtpA/Prc
MKKTVSLLALALMLALVPAVFAGGEQCAREHAAKKAKLAAHGWLGLDTEKTADGGWAVKSVAPGSPAAQAGFRAGDVLVAVNGVSFQDKEKAKAAKANLKVGSQVTYTVARSGARQQLTATLAPVPETVLAKWMAEDEKAEKEAAKVAKKD